jgi:hypothetical protein
MYARGILFGTMKYELGDHAYIRCPETGLSADLEFKTKGYFSGTYNAIGGYIKDANGKNLFELSGQWNEEMYIKDLTVRTGFLGCLRLANSHRLARKSYYLMPHTLSIHRPALALWKNKTKESHRDCGTK